MKVVTYCKNSTITEAWGSVRGLPAELDEEEVGALAHFGRKRFGGLQRQPSVVVMQRPKSEPVPPFWQQQFTWDDRHHLVRIGHRYLSVHFLAQGDKRYETYEKSLKPALEGWLATYEETLLGASDQYPLDRVQFGYVNTFHFPVLGLDLSKYFRLSLEIGVEAAQKGLLALETNFRLFDELHASDVIINLLVNSRPDEDQQLRVQTKVVAERRGIEEYSFKDSERILEDLLRAKEAAKAMFFDFATEETHRLMGAQYASDCTSK
jgi:uncharacterized protein (TIGR04255 family)